jgi:hypothetical protein
MPGQPIFHTEDGTEAPQDGTPSLSPSPEPTQNPSSAPNPAPGSFCGGGEVGNGRCSDGKKCCSKWGYCGTGMSWCG